MGFGINNDGNQVNKVGQANSILGAKKIAKADFINSAFTEGRPLVLNKNFTEEQTLDFAQLNYFSNLDNFLLNED